MGFYVPVFRKIRNTEIEWESGETSLLLNLSVFQSLWEKAVILMTAWKKGKKDKAGKGHRFLRAKIQRKKE